MDTVAPGATLFGPPNSLISEKPLFGSVREVAERLLQRDAVVEAQDRGLVLFGAVVLGRHGDHTAGHGRRHVAVGVLGQADAHRRRLGPPRQRSWLRAAAGRGCTRCRRRRCRRARRRGRAARVVAARARPRASAQPLRPTSHSPHHIPLHRPRSVLVPVRKRTIVRRARTVACAIAQGRGQARSRASCAASTAAMHRDRTSPTSASVRVWSIAWSLQRVREAPGAVADRRPAVHVEQTQVSEQRTGRIAQRRARRRLPGSCRAR